MSKITAGASIWAAAALTLLAVAVARADFAPRPSAAAAQPKFDTPFQAVLLDNGQVYYGKISDLGSEFPKMVDVYYVVNTVDPKTKATHTELVKRGRELHQPTETFLNARQIVMIEDVGQRSPIAKLIARSQAADAAVPAQ